MQRLEEEGLLSKERLLIGDWDELAGSGVKEDQDSE